MSEDDGDSSSDSSFTPLTPPGCANEPTNLIRVVLWNVVQVQLEQEVVLLQGAEHAGKAAGPALHAAERRHADLAGLMAADEERNGSEL